MSTPGRLLAEIDETLALLDDKRVENSNEQAPKELLPSLLKQCEEACESLESDAKDPIRAIHHFACTGGTLLSRCIEAMPNTVVLSEIDPLSTILLNKSDFAPSDLIRQSQTNLRPLPDRDVIATFLASLEVMHKSYRRAGRRLVIRDHTHSQFCMSPNPNDRPNLHEILGEKFEVSSIVTVRHPLDSFISLRRKKWVMFEPDSLDEYCRRYLLFLETYRNTPILRYEDFVEEPQRSSAFLADSLMLAHTEHWRDLLPVIELTGDSGRKGDEIEPRQRREVPGPLIEEARHSRRYHNLCERLNYDADPAAPVYAVFARADE